MSTTCSASPNGRTTDDLGDPAHRPAELSGRDLVIAVRGRLFLRYPATVVYLTSAEIGGAPNFDVDPAPDATRNLPTFQGRIGADVSFFGFSGFDPDRIGSFWLVFEEPPAGYRFANDVGGPGTPGRLGSQPRSRDRCACSSAATGFVPGPV